MFRCILESIPHRFQVTGSCSSLSDLPEELQIDIFKLLDIRSLVYCMKVCKKWRKIAQRTELWKKIDLSQFRQTLNDEHLITLWNGLCTNASSMSLKGCVEVDGKGIAALANLCTSLETLNISYCRPIYSTGYFSGVTSCQRLRELYCSGIGRLYNTDIQELASKCSQLEVLDVSWCPLVSVGVRALAFGCPNLRVLNLRGCTSVDDNSVSSLRFLRGLVSLNLQCCNITDTGLEAVSLSSSSIEHLNVSECATLTNAGLLVFMENQAFLKSLEVSECVLLNDHSLGQLCRYEPDLRKFDGEMVPGLTDATVKSLSQLYSLESAHLSGCDHISDDGLVTLLRSTSLKVLEADGCCRLTNTTIHAALDCTSLRFLSVLDCDRICLYDDKEVIEAIKRSNLRIRWPISKNPGSSEPAPSSDKRRCRIL